MGACVSYNGRQVFFLHQSPRNAYGLTPQDEAVKFSPREFIKDPRTFPQLERAMKVIPHGLTPVYTLVQNFLNNVNCHYYIIYPPSFLEQYQQWWAAPAEGRLLGVQWTCLLLMLQKKLENELGDTIQRLSEQYHEAGRELSSSVPIGYSHLVNLKSKARFVECWHVLRSAIREAQELSIHQESRVDQMPEFELAIRRRLWCVLNTWDWQISTLLGRPIIIDRADCKVGLPSLALKGTQYSPLTHMKMQSSLIHILFGRFGLTKNIIDPKDVQEYQETIQRWIKDFPPPYDANTPDKSLGMTYPWIVLHRHYLRTITFSMLLDTIRAFIDRKFTTDVNEAELQIRRDGIGYYLKLMVSLRATVLCSAVLHDENHTLPRRDDVFKAIDDAHVLLQRLRTVTKSARTSYDILSRIIQRLPRTNVSPTLKQTPHGKRLRINSVGSSSAGISNGVPPLVEASPAPVSSTSGIPYEQIPQASNHVAISSDVIPIESYDAPPPYLESQSQVKSLEDEILQAGAPTDELQETFFNISEEDLGELAKLWDFEPLDFDFLMLRLRHDVA
ncbi:hypothetical protein B0T10DRAFT_534696 [Thelonectria olida]|uniref:Xylanolytic transcriptional activator regulatory domain-containing protein n=1 Tax=Thelonectria olida TaxID=1576542 RepID=A0A9P8WHT4_9HYPO|nr:hypothetical protein B0T10DRAFT_534696 [Thelonectria olida]